jgi:hypothetical protein
VTAGGRVLAASATATDLKSAVALAYETMKSVKFAQMHFRKDIAQRLSEYLSLLIIELSETTLPRQVVSLTSQPVFPLKQAIP